jgi:hypothetical protein
MTTSGYTDVFRRIEYISPKLSEWCPITKGHTLAALVIALRPAISVEIGVWQGSSLLPIALAHKAIGFGRVIAVDAWDKFASIEGQQNKEDVDWWIAVDYEKAYQTFITAIAEEGVSQFVEVVRARSDEYTPPDNINLLHLDGNHSDQAVRDVQRFAPKMANGGIACLDDYDWAGGGVRKACAAMESLGWIEYARLGTGGLWRRK